jgi:hypothetical protein
LLSRNGKTADDPIAAISLRAGDALRIQGGGLALVFQSEGRAWEIEIVLPRERWWQRWIRAWREDRLARTGFLRASRLLQMQRARRAR